MKIDKSRFLLLAGALAVAACTTESENDDQDAGGGGTGATGGSGGGASGEAGAAGEGGSGGGSAGAAGTAGGAGMAGSGGSAGSAGTGGAAGSSGSSGAAGAGGGCDDSVGTPGDCETLPASCGAWAVDYCDSAVLNLKPAVAEAAVDCMLALTDCYDPNPYDCVRGALENACEDPSADADCTAIVAACASTEPITEDECHAMIDGLSAQARATVLTCATTDGCTYGLWSCIESL